MVCLRPDGNVCRYCDETWAGTHVCRPPGTKPHPDCGYVHDATATDCPELRFPFRAVWGPVGPVLRHRAMGSEVRTFIGRTSGGLN